MGIIENISEFLKTRSSVQAVADDPQMSAELLLLIRTMIADGEMKPEELDLLKRLCKSLFDIAPEDVPDVIRFLRETGYETDSEQAAAMFDEMPASRKQELMTHLIMMAMIDAQLHESERAMLQGVAQTLGYTREQIDGML